MMKKYKVEYKGFIYVEAEDSEEAIEKAIDGDIVYDDINYYIACEVDDFVITID